MAAEDWREMLFDQVFEELSFRTAADASVAEREESGTFGSNFSLTYGELSFQSLAVAIDRIRQDLGLLSDAGGVFCDLGSGVGKGVIAAVLLHEFDKCYGIEILSSLHNFALEAQGKWDELKVSAAELSERQRATAITFTNGDFASSAASLADVDLAFANSTAFDENVMKTLARAVEAMRPGSLVITFSMKLPSAAFEVVAKFFHCMSWGEATVYIHRRLAKRDAFMSKLAQGAVGAS